MLNLVLVEAALELVPANILRHPSVRRNAKRQGKRPEETLLDRSLHHYAMRELPLAEKRGRPDIVQFCLLEALGAPLNRQGKLRVWVSTLQGKAIEVDPAVRLPRDCNRFKSLMEQLFLKGRVPPKGDAPLLRLTNTSLRELRERINPTRTIALTSHGASRSLEELCVELANEERPMVFLGAYPSGKMEGETLDVANEAVSIYPEALEAWVVTSRLVYEYEKALGVS